MTGLLAGGAGVPVATAGTEVDVVLDRTPSTPRAAASWRHWLITADGAVVEVLDVQRPVPGLIVHRGRVTQGEIGVGAPVYVEIEIERRRAISRSHTATHLVHRAFRGALGESAAQAGSENSPGRFRFDFTAGGAVPPSVLRDAEDEVNQVLIGDLDVRAAHTSIDEARAMGALALFREMRDRSGGRIGDYRASCAAAPGRVSQLGLVKILGESSTAPASAGSRPRRPDAFASWPGRTCWSASSASLKAPREELPERVAGLVSRPASAERDRGCSRPLGGGDWPANAEDIGGVAVMRVPDGTPVGACWPSW